MPIKLGGLAAGEEARIVVAAVDVGILNLTQLQAAGAGRLLSSASASSAAEIRDLYGQLIDGMQGTRGRDPHRRRQRGAELQGSAADAGAARALFRHRHGRRRTARPQVELRHPGVRRHRARDGGRLDQGQGRPAPRRRDRARSGGLTATLPRFLLTGDRRDLHLDLDNVEGPAGDYTVESTVRRAGRHRRRRRAQIVELDGQGKRVASPCR